MSSVIVEHKNGKVFDLDKLGYRVKTFEPWGINWTNTTVALNKYVILNTDTKLQPKSMNLELNVMAHDMTGLQIRFLDLTRVFSGDYDYWIYFAEIPYIRWEVKLDGEIDFKTVGNAGFGQVTVPLKCLKGVGETTHSTADIPEGDGATDYGVGIYGIGTHFQHSGDVPMYIYSGTRSFKIYNPGNIPLRGDGLHGKVIVEASGANSITITNKTNDSKFSYKKSFSKLVLDGYLPYVDGKVDFTNSNHGCINLDRYWNKISVSCSGDFTILFDLHFYY